MTSSRERAWCAITATGCASKSGPIWRDRGFTQEKSASKLALPCEHNQGFVSESTPRGIDLYGSHSRMLASRLWLPMISQIRFHTIARLLGDPRPSYIKTKRFKPLDTWVESVCIQAISDRSLPNVHHRGPLSTMPYHVHTVQVVEVFMREVHSVELAPHTALTLCPNQLHLKPPSCSDSE